MTLAWMLYALGVGALITIAAVSAEWALKCSQKSVRFVWTAAIALTLAFTSVAPLRAPKPLMEVALPFISVVESPQAATQPALLERVIASGRAALDLLVLPVQKSMDWAKAAPRVANVSAGAFWLLSATIALFVLLTVYTRSMRESLRWPRLTVLGRNVRVAPDTGPAVMGVAPPEIVIPRWVLTRPIEDQQLVLEHESEHVRAHDPLLLIFACVAVALMPWNPALWFMWSRLRLAVELDCDRRVLLRGVHKPSYGELLVELSSRRPWNSLATPAFAWGTSHLEKRLVAMTARPARFSVARRVASAGVIAVALVAACTSEMPTAAQVQAMDVSKFAARVPLSDSTVYFVNKQAVSKQQATTVTAGDISSVEVKRAAGAHTVAEVYVTLVDDSARKPQLVAAKADSIRELQPEAVNAQPPVTMQRDSSTVRVRPTRDPGCGSGAVTAIGTNDARIGIRGQSAAGAAQPCPQRVDPLIIVNGVIMPPGEIDLKRRDPLIIIDGVIMAPGAIDLNTINRNDIESVEVIKGAAAANRYGSAAANGVISIKLKK